MSDLQRWREYDSCVAHVMREAACENYDSYDSDVFHSHSFRASSSCRFTFFAWPSACAFALFGVAVASLVVLLFCRCPCDTPRPFPVPPDETLNNNKRAKSR